jgi:hypothetical protein
VGGFLHVQCGDVDGDEWRTGNAGSVRQEKRLRWRLPWLHGELLRRRRLRLQRRRRSQIAPRPWQWLQRRLPWLLEWLLRHVELRLPRLFKLRLQRHEQLQFLLRVEL